MSLARWQALTLSLLVVGYSGYYLCRSNLSIALPLIIAELAGKGMSPSAAQLTLGSVASLGVLAYAVGKFPSGALADRFGGRRNFLFGMAGAITFTLLFAVSGTVPLFTLTWMCNRFAQSLGWAGAVKILSKWFSFRRYGTVMSILSLSYLFGDALARQFLSLLLLLHLPWRMLFIIGAAVLALFLIACLFLLKESPSAVGEPEPDVNPANLFAHSSEATLSIATLLRTLVTSPGFLIACVLSLGTTLIKETFSLWTPTYFMQTAGMSAAAAASNSSLFPFLGGVSVLLSGWLSDRVGRTGRALVILFGLLLSAVAMLALAADVAGHSHVWTVVLVSGVAFLLYGPYSYLAGAVSMDFGGKQGSGAASGIIDGIGYLGGTLAGSGMAGISIEYGWSGAFVVLATISLLSSAAAFFFLRQERLLENASR